MYVSTTMNSPTDCLHIVQKTEMNKRKMEGKCFSSKIGSTYYSRTIIRILSSRSFRSESVPTGIIVFALEHEFPTQFLRSDEHFKPRSQGLFGEANPSQYNRYICLYLTVSVPNRILSDCVGGGTIIRA